MNEVEKMYKNVGIELRCNTFPTIYDCPKSPHVKCKDCENFVYPPFTAEKQLAILITLVNYNLYEEDKRLMIDSFNGEIYIGFYQDIDLIANATDKEFSKCVAKLVNKLWQDLTEEECKQIKEILE